MIMWFIVGFSIIVIIFIFSAWRDKKLLATVTKPNRGTEAERMLILKLLKAGISADMIFHDLYIKKHNGAFSQIDLLVITDVGIIVFEVKDYSGWIFGNGKQARWTQVLAYGKRKYQFYNPIMQNSKHIIDLRKQLRQFEKIQFYSVVVFYGDCELKDVSFVPNGTFIAKSARVLDVVDVIIKENVRMNFSNDIEIKETLKKYVENGENIEIQRQHIEDIKDMLGGHRIFK